MKKMHLALFFSALCSFSFGQQQEESNVIVPSSFHVTKPLREIAAENPVDENKVYPPKESKDRLHRIPNVSEHTYLDGPVYGNELRTLQQEAGKREDARLTGKWAGQTASGFRPFDPSGAVGPNHYIQMINSTTFKVYNKTGGTLLTATLGNLWSPATANNGDPIVMYDKTADRWFLAQFGNSTDRKIYIAVSTTNDPTGSYYTYTYVSPQFPDYLKFGIWSDGYYMTSNQSTQKVFCFERTAMLAGTPGARSVFVNYTPPKSTGFFCPLPADAGDGTLPPAGTPCPIMSYSDNGWGASFSDAVHIYNMSVNWVPATPTATITLANTVSTAAFDGSYDVNWNDCPQPGTTQKLDGIGGVLMYRAQFKARSGFNSVVLNWGVKISTTQRGIKWCELRQNTTTGVWTMYQEGIYSPGTDTRWMGSIGMDNNGSIGLTYVKSNSTSTFPGLYYTGRRECDPLGTMPITEVLVKAGTGSQTGGNRFGDYAHMTLDPDGVTFWATSEYMGGTTGASAARTEVYNFQITPCATNAAGVSIALSSGSNPSCTGSSVTFTATPTNGGTAPSYQWLVNGANAGTNSPTFTTTSLTNGQVVSCVMTSNLAGVTGNPATSNAITMVVNSSVTPAVSIALTSGSNPTCAGSSLTFTATPTNGGTAPSYQWTVNGVNAGTNSPSFTTSTLTNGAVVNCVMTSNSPCASTTTATSGNITMTVNASVTPSVSIALTAGTNPSPSGASMTFTASAVNGGATPSYQWRVNGANVGTNSATFTTTTLTNGQIVTCVLTSNATCAVPATATSNAITVTITGGGVYCAAGSTSTTGEYISRVVMGSINNLTGRTQYSNFTNLSTNLTIGVATPVTVTLTSANTNDRVLIWVDWNNNFSFTDAGEAVYVSGLGVGPFTTNITAPTGTPLGNHRMRIRLTRNNSGPNNTPCGNGTRGEVEDYTLNVLAGGSNPVVYCGASTTSTTFEYISNVTMGSVNNTTSSSSYSDYSAQATAVAVGSSTSIAVTIGGAYSSDRVLIWCDWNQDGDFDDVGENVYASATGVGPFSSTITVPAGAINGPCRMRIRLTDSATGANLTPCGASSYGEVEDYSITVSGGTNKGASVNLVSAPMAEQPLLEIITLSVYPNPNNGNFTVAGKSAGEYFLVREDGVLIQKIDLTEENNFMQKVTDLFPGMYIISGQNKQGITKQKVSVTR